MNKPVTATTFVSAIIIMIVTGCLTSTAVGQEKKQAKQTTDQTFPSVEARRLQTEIATERQAIVKEKIALELRENELKTLETAVDKKLAEIDDKLVQLAAQQKAIEAALARKDGEEQKKILELSKIYERMDPSKAAIALAGLDEKLAAAILKNMKVKAAAQVLDNLNKQKTVELSKTFSTIQIE